MIAKNNFGTLFKKYRLKSEISTLSEFGKAMTEKGLVYEDSIFSHWQKGTRIPSDRNILLKLLDIFIERKAITTIKEANEFLSSVGDGYLSEEELKKFSLQNNDPVFQVPNEIANFNGRQKIISSLFKQDLKGKVVIIHGVAGVGKTALAIKLGHVLKHKYKDGVLWYKVEEDNIMDILFSIAKIFGEDLSNISSKQVRATVVRSLLSGKNVLLFLDSGELSDDIQLLIPSSKFATTIITSQKNYLKIPINYIDIGLTPFTKEEVLSLFKQVLKEKYKSNNVNAILSLAKKAGNLPLSIHILAQELLHSKIPVTRLHDLLNKEKERNLYKTIALSYQRLNTRMKSILASAAIFKGKDFSPKSIAYINGLSGAEAAECLENLNNFSLIEHSTKNRYRMHPAIREFVREKLNYPRLSSLMLIAILVFTFLTIWWIYLQIFLSQGSFLHTTFGLVYCVMALYGVICGIDISFKWGGLKTLLGRAIFMFSLGLLMQIFGQISYAYYTILKHITVPYPSIGDLGFFGTIPFYIYGVYLLAKSSGIKISVQSFRKKILALIIPGLVLLLYYFSFFYNYEFDFTSPVKIFFDIAQPLGNVIYVSIAVITYIFSRSVLNGIMYSKAFLLLVALIVQSIADYIFLYNSSSFYTGNYMDLIYLVSYFVMVLALLNLKSLQVNIKNI